MANAIIGTSSTGTTHRAHLSHTKGVGMAYCAAGGNVRGAIYVRRMIEVTSADRESAELAGRTLCAKCFPKVA